MIYCFYMIFLFQFFNIFKTISTTTKDYLYDLPYHINIYWNMYLNYWWVRLWCLMPLSTIFQYIVADSFIGGGNRSTRRKSLTCLNSLTNFITWYCIKYTSPWAGFEITTLVVIGTGCTGSKSNMTITCPCLNYWKQI